MTMLSTIAADPDLTALEELLDIAADTDLVALLGRKSATLTVFAPEDDAFVALAIDLGYRGTDPTIAAYFLVEAFGRSDSSDAAEVLNAVLSHHVVEGSIDPEGSATLVTLSGSVTLRAGELRDTGSGVAPLALPRAIETANGELHKIEGVLLNVDVAPVGPLSAGTDGDDALFGGDGADLIQALSGNDDIRSGEGADIVFANGGDDAIWAGDGADTVTGGAGNDRLYGDRDDDELLGEAGADSLNGGSGNDTVKGGPGDDRLAGNSGDDRQWGGTGNDDLKDQDGHDTLQGSRGDDTLRAGKGDDLLDGGEDDDRLAGNQGADQLLGAGGDDILRGGLGPDTLMGGTGADTLLGGYGADSLKGGPGADHLISKGGTEQLEGGAGADTFTFWRSPGDRTILDFDPAMDLLDLRGALNSYEITPLSGATLITRPNDPAWSVLLQGVDEASQVDIVIV